MLSCPSCTGPLQPWGHARARTVRDHGTTVVALRPRRARCRSCRGTHVLLPAVVAPRRADTTAVIGSALQASARGTGYRRIAAQLARPLSTVRRWIRAGSSRGLCPPGRAEIPLLPGPRAPAPRRHPDDGEPARTRPARGSVTTTAPP